VNFLTGHTRWSGLIVDPLFDSLSHAKYYTLSRLSCATTDSTTIRSLHITFVPAFNSAVDPFFVLHYSHQSILVASSLTGAATTPYWCLEDWRDGAEAKPFRTSGVTRRTDPTLVGICRNTSLDRTQHIDFGACAAPGPGLL
jgi:hypothetical protein